MNIGLILEALDGGLDIEQVSMLERLIRGLRDQGITDEQELLRAATFALTARLQDLAR